MKLVTQHRMELSGNFLSFMDTCVKSTSVESHLDTDYVQGIPVVTGKDGMTIKPGFQLVPRTKEIVGG